MLFMIVSISVANRPLSIGTDSYTYAITYKLNALGYYKAEFEPAYNFIMDNIGAFTTDYKIFFFATSGILLFTSIAALTKAIKEEQKTNSIDYFVYFFVLSILFVSPFFFSLQVNILRHGLATPFILLAYIYLNNRKHIISLALFLIAINFHYSSIMYLAVAPIIFLSQRKIAFILISLSALYLTNTTSLVIKPVMSTLGLEHIFLEASDYGAHSDYTAGVRFDLWGFTAIIVAISLLLKKYCRGAGLIAKTTATSFIPFLIFGHMVYADRLLVTTWFMIPLIPTTIAIALIQKYPKIKSPYLIHILLFTSFFYLTTKLDFYSQLS
ncbi:hypothetical protein D3C78_346710 [compost metagenome]